MSAAHWRGSLCDAQCLEHLGSGAVSVTVQVVEILVAVVGGDVARVVETLGMGDAREHHALDVGLLARRAAVAHALGKAPWAVAAPVGHVVLLVDAQENHAVPTL